MHASVAVRNSATARNVHICTYSRELIDMFSDLTKTLSWLFGGHCLRRVFQTLRDYDLAKDPAICTRFDDLDLISRSQVCQNHKLQLVSGFLSIVV